jgi:hypothetical protein
LSDDSLMPMLIDRNETPAPTVATTFSKRRKAGFLVATQEEVQIAVKVIYKMPLPCKDQRRHVQGL